MTSMQQAVNSLICDFENELIAAEGSAKLLEAVSSYMPAGEGFEDLVDTISATLITQMEAMREAYDRLHDAAMECRKTVKTEDGQ